MDWMARLVGSLKRGKNVGSCSLMTGCTVFYELQVLKSCTLEFSKKGVPTISKILPLYKLMVVKLTALAAECLTEEHNLAGALLAGAWMATKYINKALVGDFALLGAGMHLFSHDQFEC
jgi:hypothetical protein